MAERLPIRFAVGDPVRCNRERPPSGTWRRYDGREGWVAAVNTQTFTNGDVYVEIGVAWSRRRPGAGGRADAWFLPDELVPR
jgi:hypothetical protein